jgi:tetratricopeptide (TPR) repeat protein
MDAETAARMKEHLSDWPHDSLVKEGSEYVVRVAYFIDAKIKEEEKEQMLEIAIVLFNEALERKVDYTVHSWDEASVYSWRGLAKKFQGKYYSALLDNVKASKLEPDNFKHYESKADCKLKLEDYFGAIQDFTIALNKTSPDKYSQYHKLYADRGYCYLQLKKYVLAIQSYNNAIALRGYESLYFMLRGYAKLGLNKIRDACRDFSKAGELGNLEAYESIKDYCNP